MEDPRVLNWLSEGLDTELLYLFLITQDWKKGTMFQEPFEQRDRTYHLEDVSRVYLSSDVHQPDHLPRFTQTTIGKQLVPDTLPEGKYNVFPQPQPKQASVSQSRFPQPQQTPTTQFSCVPVCDRLTCGKSQDQLRYRCKAPSTVPSWWHAPPFWWAGPARGPSGSVGNPNDYSYTHFGLEELENKYPRNLKEEIQVERPERYIPGQIHAAGPLSTQQPCQCPAVDLGSYASPYSTFRGPSHWPASAMEERRRYVTRGSDTDQESSRMCPFYNKIPDVIQDREKESKIPCPYYSDKSGEPSSSRNDTKCRPCSSNELKDVEKNHNISEESTSSSNKLNYNQSTDEIIATVPNGCKICSYHKIPCQQITNCPVEPGKPLASSDGVLSGENCYDSPQEQRKKQLYKVGMPFRTEACRWYNRVYPSSIPKPIGRPPKKMFPEMRFSSL